MDMGKRRHLRVPARLPCDILAQALRHSGEVVDLSLGGALIKVELAPLPPVGTELVLGLRLNGKDLRLGSCVVRHAGEALTGVAFQGLGRDVEALLARFVQDQERKLLRSHLHLQ